MTATVRTSPVLHQRAKLMLATALLALSMAAGVAVPTTHVGAAKRQPKVYCVHYTADQWYVLEHEWTGPAGYWDCSF